MSNNSDGQLYARIGSELKEDLADLANVKDTSISEETKLAVRKHIKEHRGERVEYISIARLSEWDMYSLALYSMAGLSAVLTLAGFDMLIYAIGFTAMGLLGWVGEAQFGRHGIRRAQEAEG